MRHIQNEYGFDNVFIVPRNKQSNIVSRSDIDTGVYMNCHTHGAIIKYDLPLMLAPMSFFSVNAIRLIDNRFLSFLPRIQAYQFEGEKEHRNWRDIQVRIKYAKQLFEEGYNFGAAISISDPIGSVVELSKYVNTLVVDTANGYSVRVQQYVTALQQSLGVRGGAGDTLSRPNIICGNIVSHQGYDSLNKSGCDLIRIGIGSGSNCTTSATTAIGRPILTALLTMNDMMIATNKGVNNLICDGGIKNSHDFSLALLFAKHCMVSGIFKYTQLNDHYAYAKEGPIPAYGMASEYAKQSKTFVEGKLTLGEYVDFETEYTQLKEGLQSAMSYLDASDLEKYRASDFELVHSLNY